MRVEIRQANIDDLEAACEVEHGAFPPALAASRANIQKRLQQFPQGFLVALLDGKIVGHIMSGATDKEDISDESLKAMEGHIPAGRHLVIFAVAVLPDYQRRGIASELIRAYLQRVTQGQTREAVLLICQTHLIKFYESFGFAIQGRSASTHGGAEWYEMRYTVQQGNKKEV